IVERINDLRSFDVTVIKERYDPRARELCDSVNNTIADVFGRNTRAYWNHSVPSFDAIPVVLGSPKRSSAELRGFYKAGIDKAVTKLTAIAESLKSKLEKLERQAISENEPVASSAPDYEEDVTVVEGQKQLPVRVEHRLVVREPAKVEAVKRPAGKVVVKVPGMGQNPFAVKDFEKKRPQPKSTGAVDLQTRIGAIVERINDLRSFDVTVIKER